MDGTFRAWKQRVAFGEEKATAEAVRREDMGVSFWTTVLGDEPVGVVEVPGGVAPAGGRGTVGPVAELEGVGAVPGLDDPGKFEPALLAGGGGGGGAPPIPFDDPPPPFPLIPPARRVASGIVPSSFLLLRKKLLPLRLDSGCG